MPFLQQQLCLRSDATRLGSLLRFYRDSDRHSACPRRRPASHREMLGDTYGARTAIIRAAAVPLKKDAIDIRPSAGAISASPGRATTAYHIQQNKKASRVKKFPRCCIIRQLRDTQTRPDPIMTPLARSYRKNVLRYALRDFKMQENPASR